MGTWLCSPVRLKSSSIKSSDTSAKYSWPTKLQKALIQLSGACEEEDMLPLKLSWSVPGSDISSRLSKASRSRLHCLSKAALRPRSSSAGRCGGGGRVTESWSGRSSASQSSGLFRASASEASFGGGCRECGRRNELLFKLPGPSAWIGRSECRCFGRPPRSQIRSLHTCDPSQYHSRRYIVARAHFVPESSNEGPTVNVITDSTLIPQGSSRVHIDSPNGVAPSNVQC